VDNAAFNLLALGITRACAAGLRAKHTSGATCFRSLELPANSLPARTLISTSKQIAAASPGGLFNLGQVQEQLRPTSTRLKCTAVQCMPSDEVFVGVRY